MTWPRNCHRQRSRRWSVFFGGSFFFFFFFFFTTTTTLAYWVITPPRRIQVRIFLVNDPHFIDGNNNPIDDPGTLERYRKRQWRRRQRSQQRITKRVPITPPTSNNDKEEGRVSQNSNSEHLVSQNIEEDYVSSWKVSKSEPQRRPTLSFVGKREKEEGVQYNNDNDAMIPGNNERNEESVPAASSNISSPRREEKEGSLWNHQQQQQQQHVYSVIPNETRHQMDVNVSSSNQPLDDQNTTTTTTMSKNRSSSVLKTRAQPINRWRCVLQTTLQRVPQALKQTAQRSLQRRSMKRIIRVTTWQDNKEEEEIIQDVDYHYVRRDPIDVFVPFEDNRTFDNARSSKVRPEESMTNASVIMIPNYRPKRPRPTSELKNASTRNEKRRIYNPYNIQNSSPENMDSVDRIGQFLADTVDQFFWGKYDDDDDDDDDDDVKEDDDGNRQPPPPPRKRQRPSKQTHNNTTQRFSRPQHWKDRLEERFDSIMGIHEDGEVYNRWFQYAQQEEENVPRKRPVKKKPFWEEEGSLVALLLGRTKDGQRLSWKKALTPRGGDGSLVTIFRTVLQATLVLASYAFRWASVRGAIPQPVVVLGVSAAGLCVRQHRVRAMLLALILFRTVGELVHGGLYGQDGWEDDTESP